MGMGEGIVPSMKPKILNRITTRKSRKGKRLLHDGPPIGLVERRGAGIGGEILGKEIKGADEPLSLIGRESSVGRKCESLRESGRGGGEEENGREEEGEKERCHLWQWGRHWRREKRKLL